MEYDGSFGYWLALRRQSLHLARGELAARIGCAVVTLRKIEADERRPSRELAEQLARQFSIAAPERETFIRVARGELPTERLPLPRLTIAVPTNLPSPATVLLGRAGDVAAICAMLSRPDVRLLTLTGAPGVGKSRLALEAASTARGIVADGVFLIDLAPLREPGLILDAVAHALRVSAAGGQSLADRLGRYLLSKQIMLVLDNFEHLLNGAPLLSELLAITPQLKLLVTSRVALELSREHRFTVLPLVVPPAAGNERLPLRAAEVPQRYPAVELFVQRARAVLPTFALTDANIRAVGEVCRRLDGLPLAIELAAARSTLFTPQELLARLDDRFAVLTSHARDLPARHLTLRLAIDWSFDQLAPDHQLLFQRLGVFVGGCLIEAAQQVANADGALANTVVDGIATLVAGSLLQRREGSDGRSRFAMLESVREYAMSRLVASGEAETIRRQHTRYYLQMAETAAQAWEQPTEPALLQRLVSVRDNLRAALHQAHTAGDATTLFRLNAALFSFWTICSPLNEARTWLERTLELSRPGDEQTLIAAEAKVLAGAGYVAAATSDFGQAYAYFERSLALYHDLNDSCGVAWSIRGQAVVDMMRDQHAVARQQIDESLRICRRADDAWGIAWSLYALGFLLLAEGDLARARPALEDALVHLRQQGMIFGVIRALFALGHIRFEHGDVAGAEGLYREGLVLSREMPLLAIVTIGLDGLAIVAAATGRLLRAARLWGATEALQDVTGESRVHVFQSAYERALGAARAEVAGTEWAEAWAAGRALAPDQAVAEALEDVGRTSLAMDR